ncbi:MAG: hypothetical protein HRU19_12430 [Pseudobacteriovorax sp.]|nr:hypothetical protein [Pseudobacteriovorax sp.]
MQGEKGLCANHQQSPQGNLDCDQYLQVFRCLNNREFRAGLPLGSLSEPLASVAKEFDFLSMVKERSTLIDYVTEDFDIDESYGLSERFVLSWQDSETLPDSTYEYEPHYPSLLAKIEAAYEAGIFDKGLRHGYESMVAVDDYASKYQRLISDEIKSLYPRIVVGLVKAVDDYQLVKSQGGDLTQISAELHTWYSLFYRLTSLDVFSSVIPNDWQPVHGFDGSKIEIPEAYNPKTIGL